MPRTKPGVGASRKGSKADQIAQQSRVTDYFSKRLRRLSRSPPSKLKRTAVTGASGPQDCKTEPVGPLEKSVCQTQVVAQTPDVTLAAESIADGAVTSGVAHRKRKSRAVDVLPPASVVSSAETKHAKRRLFQTAPPNHTSLIDAVSTVANNETAPSLSKSPSMLAADSSATAVTKNKANGTERKLTAKKLGRVRNLTELRARLAANSSHLAQLEQQRDVVERSERDVVKLHLSPVKAQTPEKITTDVVPPKSPCYERYAALTARLSPSGASSLPLPGHFAALFESFRHLDVIASMLHGRGELITFDKVRPAIQQLVKRNFEKRNLGQIRTVYPEAYHYRLQENTRRFGHRLQENNSKSELILEPNLQTDLVGCGQKLRSSSPSKPIPLPAPSAMRFSPVKLPVGPLLTAPSPIKRRLYTSPWKSSTAAAAASGDVKSDGGAAKAPTLDGNRRLMRASVFRSNLIDAVCKLHTEYLKENQIEMAASDSIQRWHPRFLLESVAEIKPAELPSTSEDSKRPTTTAKQLFNKLICKEETAFVAPNVNLAKVPSPTKPSLQGVSTSLLAKIRAKAAAKELQAMRHDPVKEKRKASLNRLPALVPHIRVLYAVERKDSIAIASLVSKLAQSYPSLNKDELEAHIDLLCEVVPQWVSKRRITNGVYVRVDQHMKDLPSLLEARVKECLKEL